MRDKIIGNTVDPITVLDATSPDTPAAKAIIALAKRHDCLVEIDRETYGGGDGKAINRHSQRTYVSPSGNVYYLTRTLDTNPKYFESYGPMPFGFKGICPKLAQDDWGNGMTWARAEEKFIHQVMGAELISKSCGSCEANYAGECKNEKQENCKARDNDGDDLK